MSTGARRPAVLWWGRFDADYSRNAVVRDAFEALGWAVHTFRPRVSWLGDLQAAIARPAPADLVWVPCFRQRDAAAAHRYARARGLPLVIDPLISAYDKQVGERRRFPAGGHRARRLLAWEKARLRAADRVVADTEGHRAYFHETFGIAPDALFVVPVGAEESRFVPQPVVAPDGRIEVLFYGSFIGLQGARWIVEAARELADERATITLLGDGPERAACEALAAGSSRVRFEPWIDYADLPVRIGRADLLLGVFGATPKAARVIPNKVYQALACARPVITRHAEAYPGALLDAPPAGLRFVTPGDPGALAGALSAAVTGFLDDPQSLVAAAHSARDVYETWFAAARVRGALAAVLRSLDLPADAAGS